MPAEVKITHPPVRLGCSNAARAELNEPSRSMSMTLLKPLDRQLSRDEEVARGAADENIDRTELS
jgi:hypothetical protein